MGAFTSSSPPASAPAPSAQKAGVKQARTAAATEEPVTVDPYQEPVIRARAEEAEIMAAVAAETAALRKSLAQDLRTAKGEARVDRRRLHQDLAAELAGRLDTLRSDQGSSRADAAARGISSGATARALLQGLADDAEGDMAGARSETSRRLADIRRGLEAKQRANLLALAEQRQRGRLTVEKARNDTIFAEREAWLRQTTDRQKVLDKYNEDMAAYQRDLADYNRRLAEQQAEQRAAERGALIEDVSGGLLDVLFRRR